MWVLLLNFWGQKKLRSNNIIQRFWAAFKERIGRDAKLRQKDLARSFRVPQKRKRLSNYYAFVAKYSHRLGVCLRLRLRQRPGPHGGREAKKQGSGEKRKLFHFLFFLVRETELSESEMINWGRGRGPFYTAEQKLVIRCLGGKNARQLGDNEAKNWIPKTDGLF